ncbi:MAG: PEP-CTERM system TPR-repeat protein PrsT [Burkholderiales bacterium]|nr:PEP-CTERM system TPR-repeat protein PrsT [Burkholderiales bacterium]
MSPRSIARALRAALAAAALATLVGGCSKSEPEILADAQSRFASGDLPGAAIEAKSALARNPENARARLLLGTIDNESGKFKEAEAELRRAIELGLVEGGRVHAELARALVADGQAAKVISEIRPLDSFEPEPVTVIHAMRGRAYLLQRDRENAKRSLAAAARTGPNHAQTALLHARLLLTEATPAEALAAVDALLAAQPKNVEALMLRADLLHLLKRSAEAAPVYDAIIALRKGMIPVHVARATLMIHLNKLAEARKDVEAIARVSRNIPVGHYLRALVLVREGKLADAEIAVQHALKILPDYPAAQLLAGLIAHSRGSHASAEQILSKFLARHPSNLTARKLLAAAQIEMRKGKEAFETLEPVLTAKMTDHTVLAIAADALFLGGSLDRAGEYYQRALAARPDDPKLRTSLAAVQLQRGETEQALAELEALSKLEGPGQRADYILITTLYRRGDFAKALEAVTRLQAKEPKSPVPHNLAGIINLERKDPAAARRNFERALELDPRYFPAAANLATIDVAEKKSADARHRFEQIVAKDQKNVRAMLALAELASRENDKAAALKWLERARAARPGAIETLGMLSAHYLSVGNAAKALEYAREAASRNPSSPAALDVLGTAQMAAREYNGAIQSYVKMTQLAPRQPAAYYRLSVAQQAGGEAKGAESTLRKAIELDAAYVPAWAALAGLQINQGRTDLALKTAAEVKRLAPHAAQGYELEGEALLRAKRPAEAVKAYEAAFDRSRTGSNAVKIYVARTRAGSRAEAIGGLEQWLERNPRDQATRLVLADAHLADGRFGAAAAHYEQVLQAAPKEILALNNLAICYLALGNPRAVEVAKRAHEVAGNDANVLDTYGWVLVENGKVSDGLPLIENAKRLKPGSDEITYHLAVAMARAGNKSGARREAESVIAMKSAAYGNKARELLSGL